MGARIPGKGQGDSSIILIEPAVGAIFSVTLITIVTIPATAKRIGIIFSNDIVSTLAPVCAKVANLHIIVTAETVFPPALVRKDSKQLPV